jgi:N6-adenosine-specific RNA methylase IME4
VDKKYNIIYADPPWSFRDKNTGGSFASGAADKYPVMTVDEICQLKIKDISADDSILFMWWVASQPLEALKVVEAWGFKFKTMTGFSWYKLTKNGLPHFGMGHFTRQGVENCLLATRGKPERVSASVRSAFWEAEEICVVADLVRKHSEKPPVVRDKIVELCGDKPRIELFARQKVDGWDVFGIDVGVVSLGEAQ